MTLQMSDHLNMSSTLTFLKIKNMWTDIIAECKYHAEEAELNGEPGRAREFYELAVYYVELENDY